MEKLKIALCLSGQVRTWKYCYQNWFNKLSNLGDVDIFCHFWDYNSVPQGARRGYLEGIPPDDKLSEEEMQLIIESLKPKRIQFQSKFDDQEFLVNNWSLSGIIDPLFPLGREQFYSLMKVAHFKRLYEIENNFEYDLVIRMRPDSIFFSDLNIEKPKPNVLYSVHNFYNKQFDRYQIGDVYFHADSKTFDLVSYFFRFFKYHRILDISKEHTHPEIPFYYYVKSLMIENMKASVDPRVAVTPESSQRKGHLQGNEILTTDILK